jgi:hypothetical protein
MSNKNSTVDTLIIVVNNGTGRLFFSLMIPVNFNNIIKDFGNDLIALSLASSDIAVFAIVVIIVIFGRRLNISFYTQVIVELTIK